jgi:hypothetical protein
MRLKKLEHHTINVSRYADLFSAYNGDELSEHLSNTCKDILEIYQESNRSSIIPSLLWACVDAVPNENPLPHQRTLHCRLDVRIDSVFASNKIDHDFLRVLLVIKNPDQCDVLREGRLAFRQWLVIEFLKKLKMAGLESLKEQNSSLLLNTRVWIYGQTALLFGYDINGEQRVFSWALPEPEEAYTDPGFLIGPRLDGPPYTRDLKAS